jgi:myo-inositol-1(or 4)-monophosphatase
MYHQYLSFAIELAKEAGQIILPYAGQAGQQTMKSAKDFVTEMDIKVENFIIRRIREQYPKHRIFSEEAGSIEGIGDFEWVIDPIDGTVNYSVGLPLYGISIALTCRDEPVVAAISLPALGETFWAAKGEGAYLDGKLIKVRDSSLSEAFISFGDFAKDGNIESNKDRMRLLDSIVNEVNRVRMVGTAAFSLAYIAAGRLDAAIYLNPNHYDIAAGQLLVVEAGGSKKIAGKYTIFANDKVAQELIIKSNHLRG